MEDRMKEMIVSCIYIVFLLIVCVGMLAGFGEILALILLLAMGSWVTYMLLKLIEDEWNEWKQWR